MRSATGRRTRDDGDLEVVAAAGAVVQGDGGAGEGTFEECADRVVAIGMMVMTGSRIAFSTSVPERAPLAGGRGRP